MSLEQFTGAAASPLDASLKLTHPMDSSRLLLGLLSLAQRSDPSQGERPSEDSVEGVISKGTLKTLLTALHFRDVATVGHARQVAILAVGIAGSLGWEPRHLKVLEVAGLLHDIGKIGIPDNILYKRGKLSPQEADLMALHHRIGVDVLQACRVDKETLDIVMQSQADYKGVAEGTARIGGEVHQGARILAVADAYDSLRTEQPYRPAKSHEDALELLRDASGTRFDGNIISALERWVEREGSRYQDRLNAVREKPVAQPFSSIEDLLEASTLGHIFAYLHTLESLYDGFFVVDNQGEFVVWNQQLEGLFGFTATEMIGCPWSTDRMPHADRLGERQLDGDDCPLRRVLMTGSPETNTIQIRSARGQWIPVEVQTIPLLDGDGQLHGVAEIFQNLGDANRRSQSYRDLTLAASRDPLTQVANRGSLENQLSTMMSDHRLRTDPEPFAVMFVDVDHFKSVNDTFGHDIGDEVLIKVAQLLQLETYSGETVGRYGGEEFVIICPDTNLESAMRRADRLRMTLASAELSEEHTLRLTASFGIAAVEPGDSVESILKRADKAVFISKDSGRNCATSLTVEEFNTGSNDDSESSVKANPFIFEASFDAFLAADMIAYKLGGFVEDYKAELLDTEPGRAVMRVGTKTLFGGWGKSDDKQPVEVHLSFEDNPRSRDLRKKSVGATQTVRVKLCITPVGSVRNPRTFSDRARRVVRNLKSFLVAVDVMD